MDYSEKAALKIKKKGRRRKEEGRGREGEIITTLLVLSRELHRICSLYVNKIFKKEKHKEWHPLMYSGTLCLSLFWEMMMKNKDL